MAGTHGGLLYDVIGDDLSGLSRRSEFVPADVLDAWFDPAPSVLSVLKEEAAWMCRTSPPAAATGLERSLATRDGVDPRCVAAGGGSSDLIFRCLASWLSPSSRVFLLDPTYSEYRHVCEQVVGCSVECAQDFSAIGDRYDMIVVVNPNNPTGALLTRPQIEGLTEFLRPGGVVWIDEAYLPYVSEGQSMKKLAARDKRFVVCQSLSKSLALSGLRAAYLVAHEDVCRAVRRATPPWVISMPATLAVHAALTEEGYYTSRYAETRELRRRTAAQLASLEVGRVTESAANWVSFESGVSSAEVIDRCRKSGVLVRDGVGMFLSPPAGFIRVAVRSQVENERSVEAVRGATCRLAAR